MGTNCFFSRVSKQARLKPSAPSTTRMGSDVCAVKPPTEKCSNANRANCQISFRCSPKAATHIRSKMQALARWVCKYAAFGSKLMHVTAAPKRPPKRIRATAQLLLVNCATAPSSSTFTSHASKITPTKSPAPFREASIGQPHGKTSRKRQRYFNQDTAGLTGLSTGRAFLNKKAAADTISCRFIMSRNSFCVSDGCSFLP